MKENGTEKSNPEEGTRVSDAQSSESDREELKKETRRDTSLSDIVKAGFYW